MLPILKWILQAEFPGKQTLKDGHSGSLLGDAHLSNSYARKGEGTELADRELQSRLWSWDGPWELSSWAKGLALILSFGHFVEWWLTQEVWDLGKIAFSRQGQFPEKTNSWGIPASSRQVKWVLVHKNTLLREELETMSQLIFINTFFLFIIKYKFI